MRDGGSLRVADLFLAVCSSSFDHLRGTRPHSRCGRARPERPRTPSTWCQAPRGWSGNRSESPSLSSRDSVADTLGTVQERWLRSRGKRSERSVGARRSTPRRKFAIAKYGIYGRLGGPGSVRGCHRRRRCTRERARCKPDTPPIGRLCSFGDHLRRLRVGIGPDARNTQDIAGDYYVL